MADDLSEILAGTPERLATGYSFTEGPLWHPEGYLLFVDVRESLLYRWHPGERPFVIRENTGRGAALSLDREGRVLMTQVDNRRVVRIEPDGSETVVADRWEGWRLNGPNDLVTRSDGSVYFTDPGMREPTGEREIDVAGVVRVAPDGTVHMESGECDFPNGLAFSPNERVLYVANSRPDKYIRAFDVSPEGSLSGGRVFADVTGPGQESPDGMKVDTEGRVFCTGPGGIWVFTPSGDRLGIIRTPESPANLAFGGSDRRTVFVTARTSVYTLRVKVPGI